MELGTGKRAMHTSGCRERLEKLMPEDRLRRVKDRFDQWTAAQGEKMMVDEDMAGNEASRSSVEAAHVEDAREVDDEDEIDRVGGHGSTMNGQSMNVEPSDVVSECVTPVGDNGRELLMNGEEPYELSDNASCAPDSPASCLLDAGDPDSPYQRWLYDDQPGVRETPMSSLTATDRKLLASLILGVDVTEVFSPKRVNELAAKFGLTPGSSLDLTNGWNFELEEDRRKAWKLIKETEPYVIIGSPPCTLFSNLQQLNLHLHRDDPVWLERFESEKLKAIGHIDFCMLLYKYQLKHGRHFVHEHPWGASSWKLDSVVDMLNDNRVWIAQTDMCRFGMTSHVKVKGGEQGLVKKPTGFMTSSRHVAEELSRRCRGGHSHVHLEGGRASAAQVYPVRLCEAILRGVLKQKNADKGRLVDMPRMRNAQLSSFIGAIGGMELNIVEESADMCRPKGSWPEHWLDPVHEQDGGCDRFGALPQNGIQILKAELDALTWKDGIAVAKDDVSGVELVPELVKAARAEEMAYFKKLGVYKIVPRSHQKRTGGKIIGTRWVDVNKGDSECPNCRSRLVGREFNVGKDDTLYASTPPLEALRYVLSYAGTWGDGSSERRAVMINDVRRAYFYAKATRDLYIELPVEDPDASPDVLGKLELCLYGTRDAAKGWQETLAAQLESCGFKRGIGHPSVFVNVDRQIVTLVHGDDYVSSGPIDSLDWLEAQLAASYEIQTQKLGMQRGLERQGKVLNRVVTVDEVGWRLEADPRHAELIIEQLGVGDLREAATPGVDGADEVDRDDDVEIVGADATRFRGVAARCNYLSFDRPDIQYSTKEICREMSRPTTGSLRRLKRLGQYLKGKPRLVWRFDMQYPCTTLDVYTDANWAGCRKSRKSTSGGTIMLGSHCLKTWSKTQAIVAKSSAEAELYGVVRGATEALGMSTLIKDLGSEVGVQMHVDATAAKGIIERQGLSKVRHIDTNVLWLQEVCARKVVPVTKVAGEDNTADLGTKHLSAAAIEKNVKKMNMEYQAGRAGKAAKLHSVKVKRKVDESLEALDSLLSYKDTGNNMKTWSAIRKAGNDLRGGDRWRCRGAGGVWHRWHLTPRRSLFTPYKVAKGPGRNIALQKSRFTFGITRNGQQFEFFDDWTRPSEQHRDLGEDWIGYTVFCEDHAQLADFHRSRRPGAPRKIVDWSDCIDSD